MGLAPLFTPIDAETVSSRRGVAVVEIVGGPHCGDLVRIQRRLTNIVLWGDNYVRCRSMNGEEILVYDN